MKEKGKINIALWKNEKRLNATTMLVIQCNVLQIHRTSHAYIFNCNAMQCDAKLQQ